MGPRLRSEFVKTKTYLGTIFDTIMAMASAHTSDSLSDIASVNDDDNDAEAEGTPEGAIAPHLCLRVQAIQALLPRGGRYKCLRPHTQEKGGRRGYTGWPSTGHSKRKGARS